MSKQQNKPINPVVIVTLGVVFVAIALMLFVFQPNSSLISAQALAHGVNSSWLLLQASPLAD